MKKYLLAFLTAILLAATAAIPLFTAKKAAPATGHYAQLRKVSGIGTEAALDARRYDPLQFRRLPYTKLRTNYLSNPTACSCGSCLESRFSANAFRKIERVWPQLGSFSERYLLIDVACPTLVPWLARLVFCNLGW